MGESASEVGEQAAQAGRRAEDSDALDHVARIGLLAYGVVHLVLGWLALELALGHTGKNASTTGALHELARQPFGTALVWAVAVGLLLLVIWQGVEAGFGHREKEGSARLRKRVTSGLKVLVYAALATSALKVVLHAGSSGGGSKGMTAKVMSWPGGQWLVALVGLVIVGVGVGLAWRGWTEKFAEHLDSQGLMGKSGTAYLFFGQAGYIAKGFSLAIVGGLFVYAGVDHDPKQSGGLDSALQQVLQAPFGQVLIAVTGIGLICYGLLCFVQSRHLNR